MVFDQQDVQRVRLAGAPHPMWELVLGLQMAQTHGVPVPLVEWRQKLNQRLAGADRRPSMTMLLRSLVAPKGAFPDFLTPPGLVADIDVGCEAVLCTPRVRLSADMTAVFAHRAAPPWVRLLAGGDRDVMKEVVQAVRECHNLLVAPHWAEVRETVITDRVTRTRQLSEDGVGALLAGLPGVLSWDGRILLTRYPVDRTVYLRGRGLVLLPSYFCWGSPVTWIDADLPPVLVYQAISHRSCAEVSISARLVALLGRTRAECLRLLLAPRTTTELAEHLGMSIGNTSKQTTVLREAGLVTSSRQGAAVLHSTTSLGVALLTAQASTQAPQGFSG